MSLYARLVPVQPPDPPLTDDLLRLAPLTAPDVDDIMEIGDVDGFRELAMGAAISAVQIAHEVALGIHGWWFGDADSVPHKYVRWGFSVRLVDGRLVGMIAFEWYPVPVPRGQGVGRDGVFVSYWVAPNHRRHGYATRALSLATPWALGAFEVREIWLRPNNPLSVGVATKAGYSPTGRTLRGEALFRRGASLRRAGGRPA